MTTPRLSVIVSCFNEEQTIASCVRGIARVLPEAEIVVVHGGSDGTYDRAVELSRSLPQVRPVRNPDDRGKGHGIKTGLAHATGDVQAQFDADLQFSPDDLPAVFAPLIEGRADVVLGSRFLPASDRSAYRPSFFRDFGNRLLAAWVSLLIGQRVTDVTAGLKAWTREAIRRIDFQDDRYSYEAEIVARAGALKLRVVEAPVRYAGRAEGASMHSDNLAVIRAGLTIVFKAFFARLRKASVRPDG